MKKSRILAAMPLAFALFAGTAMAQTTGITNPSGTMSNSTNASACDSLSDAQARANCLTSHQNGPNTTVGAPGVTGGVTGGTMGGVPSSSSGPSSSSPGGLSGGGIGGSGTGGSAAGSTSGGAAGGGGGH